MSNASDRAHMNALAAVRKAWHIQPGDVYHEMLAQQAVALTLDAVADEAERRIAAAGPRVGGAARDAP